MDKETCTRRRFLVRTAALAAGGACCGLMGCNAPSARGLLEHGEAREVGISLEEYPALHNVGGAAVTGSDGMGPRLIVVRRSLSEAVAISPTCPHQGCIVNYTGDLEGNTFVCPCHNSAFGSRGELRRGPATRDLTRFPAVMKPDRIDVAI